MLKLFYAPGACSLASHIALEEAGAAFTTHRIDFKAGEQRSADYLRVNPKGRVPALLTDKGVLTESPVILGYVAQSYPDAKLADNDDSFAFGNMQAFNMWLATTVHYRLRPRLPAVALRRWRSLRCGHAREGLRDLGRRLRRPSTFS